MHNRNRERKVRRRASQTLPLVLATSTALCACSNGQTTIKDQYQSLEDCRSDWGQDAACTQNYPANSAQASGGSSYSGGSGAHFSGPSYIEGQRAAAQQNFGVHGTPGNHAIGHSVSRSVSRGGFGSTAHGHSGGG